MVDVQDVVRRSRRQVRQLHRDTLNDVHKRWFGPTPTSEVPAGAIGPHAVASHRLRRETAGKEGEAVWCGLVRFEFPRTSRRASHESTRSV